MADPAILRAPWYGDWQHHRHAEVFDFRHALDDRHLIRAYEVFNDVLLLGQYLAPQRAVTLVEVGCATGEFYRYLHARFPWAQYYGTDVSAPAIERARAKYPEGRFELTEPNLPLVSLPAQLGLQGPLAAVYSKDVVHHQVDPLGFLGQLIALAAEALVVRLRTRDQGPTEWDPERSCQFHYGGWMPYIVLNLDELLAFLRRQAPDAQIHVQRHHVVLGGLHGRYLPKDCYLPETGTAETAIALWRRVPEPGRVTVEDRRERPLAYTLGFRVRGAWRRTIGRLAARGGHPAAAGSGGGT